MMRRELQEHRKYLEELFYASTEYYNSAFVKKSKEKPTVTIHDTIENLLICNYYTNRTIVDQCFSILPHLLRDPSNYDIGCIIFEEFGSPILKIEILGREIKKVLIFNVQDFIQQLQRLRQLRGVKFYSLFASCMFVMSFAVVLLNLNVEKIFGR